MTIPTQVYLIKLAEKHNISIDGIEELWFYKEFEMSAQYQTKLTKIKEK